MEDEDIPTTAELVQRGYRSRRGPWARTEELKIRLRPGEMADLEEVARTWSGTDNVTPAMAAWAIVAMFLARCRNRKLSGLPQPERESRNTRRAVAAVEEAWREGEMLP